MPLIDSPTTWASGLDHGALAAQRMCDEVAQAQQHLRQVLRPAERQAHYAALERLCAEAMHDSINLAWSLDVGFSWCLGFLKTLVQQQPHLVQTAIAHDWFVLWSGRSVEHEAPEDAGQQTMEVVNLALERLIDVGASRAEIQTLLLMGADPFALGHDSEVPLWHLSLTREAQADVERHADLMFSESLGIHLPDNLDRLNRAINATVIDLNAVLEQDQASTSPFDDERKDGNDELRLAWNVVFVEMLETATRIALDEHHAMDNDDEQ